MSINNTQRKTAAYKSLTIGSINISGLSNRSQFCLNKYIYDENTDILTVQELAGPRGEVNPCNLEIDNMNYIRDTNNASNKGAALYVNQKHSLTKLDSISKLSKNIDSCWGLVVAYGKRFIIGSVYAKLNYEPAIKEILDMLKAAEGMQGKLKAAGIILTGDVNARHRSWGDNINCSYGNKLCESLDHSLYTICTAKTPTFLCVDGGSYIDLMIISNRLVESVSSCNTNTSVELFSGAPARGHVPLITKLVVHDIQNTNVNVKLDLTTMRWEEWTAFIEKSINDNMVNWESEDTYRLWNQLNAIITEATDKHCSTKACCKHSKPFWTESLSELYSKLKAARKKYMKRNTQNNLEILRTAKEAFDLERKTTCTEFLINKVKKLNSIQSQNFWREFNKMFKKKSDQKIDPLSDGKGGLITDPKIMEDSLFSVFFEGKHLEDQNFDETFFNEINTLYEKVVLESQEIPENYLNTEDLNADITIDEIVKAFKSKGKSVDNFNFHPQMLQKLGPSAIKLIQKIFNLSFKKHEWVWDTAEVIFLRKSGKDCYSKPGSYRPICITSYIGKRLEDIIASRMEAWLLRLGKEDKDQEGFSKKKNTIRYLSRLHHGIQSDKENNLTVLCLFIDFEKAFDSVWKQGLIVKLHQLGIRGNILKLINNFLFSRKVKLNINGNKGTDRQGSDYGLPQGSVLSPVLFKIFLMDFLTELDNRNDISILKFADDGTVKITAKTSSECVDKLNFVLQCLQNWTKKWRMKINCDKNKTEVICFHTSENNKDLIPLTFDLGCKQICRVSTTKVLGLTIDEDLSYHQHCANILKSIQTTWADLCKYSNRQWGFKQEIMLYLVKTLIISKISYASHIFATMNNMKSINSFWYHILKSIIGAVLNLRHNVAELILGVPPLLIQARMNSIKHFLKLNLKPLQNDRYREFLTNTFVYSTKSPTSIYTRLKDVFEFLSWKLTTYPSHFSQEDIQLVNNQQLDQFFNLSEKACSYHKPMINCYIEKVLWKSSLTNQYQLEGFPNSPTPSCNPIEIPNNTSRKTEVRLLSIFYKNNIFQSALYRIGRATSPMCTLCGQVEETADHLLFSCDSIPENLRLRSRQSYANAINCEIDDINTADIETGFLNASRNPAFISSCIDILKDLQLRDTVVL